VPFGRAGGLWIICPRTYAAEQRSFAHRSTEKLHEPVSQKNVGDIMTMEDLNTLFFQPTLMKIIR
jgi:hypothetical protein